MPEDKAPNPYRDLTVTPTAVVQQDEEGIVHLLMLPGQRTAAQVLATSTALATMADGGCFLLLVEILPLATITPTAFDTLYDTPVMQQLQAVAFVGDPEDTGILRPYLAHLRPGSPPAACFESEPLACAWLLQFRTAP